MSLSIRDLALECVAHLGTDHDLDTSMPTGARTYLLNVINRAMERMRVMAPQMFKETIGITWTAGRTGTINATNGSATVTMGTLSAPDDGCTINITGDSGLNEIRASATEDGTFLLLHPYTGSTGEVGCTVYGDSVLLDREVDSVLGCLLLHERRRLDILNSRDQWLKYQRPICGYDYGFGPATVDIVRQPGIPRGIWVEAFCDREGDGARYRARCAPLPSGTFRADLDALLAVRAVQDEDLNDGADVYVPVPGGRDYTIFRPLVLYAWSGSPWFKNAEARPLIAEEYKQAIEMLQTFQGNANSEFKIEFRP